jgi:small multidrug resistance pump
MELRISMNAYIYLAIAIVCEVIGTSALKEAEGFTRLWPSLIVIISYFVAFFLLSLTLKSIPTAIGYAIWSGAGTALICLIGWLYLGQALDKAAIVGVIFIVAGVLIINLFSKDAAH